MQQYSEVLDITPEDIKMLFEMNPIANAQIKAIVLERHNLELQQQLAQYRNGSEDEANLIDALQETE
jgi:hypothetical protein